MKIEFETVLFGFAFLMLALISMPKEPAPDAASQTAAEAAGHASTATAR